MTITIQIGNSDDKLTQAKWANYVFDVATMVASHKCEVHFFACSAGSEIWQNAAWVIVCDDENERKLLKDSIATIREGYNQDSVAWSESIVTNFV